MTDNMTKPQTALTPDPSSTTKAKPKEEAALTETAGERRPARPRKGRTAARSTGSTRPATDRRNTPEAKRLGLLSHLLDTLPPAELTGVLQAYGPAVAQGLIKALPVADGVTFRATVLSDDLTEEAMSFDEEIVRLDDSWSRWLHEERRKSRLAIRQARGDARATLDDLLSGKEDFNTLYKIRLAAFNAQGGSGE